MNRFAIVALAALLAAGCTNGPSTQPPPQPFGTRAATEVLKDALIVAALKAKLTADDPDSTTTLGVSSRDGVVTLRGTVRDEASRKRVAASAAGVAGVKRVVDDLRVDPRGPRPGRAIADAALAARVAAAYTAQAGLQRVTVTADRGVVTLGGTVADEKTKERVEGAARGTDGVRNVVDDIRVERP